MPLTNNSYYNGDAGCPGEGDYNVLSYYVDSQMLGYPKLLHVFAAGNDGYITCSPYPFGYATIKSGFQTGKNILTVGSMDNMTYIIEALLQVLDPQMTDALNPKWLQVELISLLPFQ